jgi:TPR repeat protein
MLRRPLLLAVLLLAASPVAFAQGPAGPSADPDALVRTGVRYEHAEGVPRDLARASRLYCEGARMGHGESQYRLGWLYANGRGVPRDDGVAATLFEAAAAQGHEHAQRMLRYVAKRQDVALPGCLQSADAPALRMSVTLLSEGSGGRETASR